MADSPLSVLDKAHVRRSFDRAASTYDLAAVLQRRIADEMIERLGVIKFEPQLICDVGCGTGYALRRLQRVYRRATVMGVDLAPEMLSRSRRRRRWFRATPLAAGDAESLPLQDRCTDMVFSSATLQWCEPSRTFAEFARILSPGGLLMFSTFGPDTLQELREAWGGVDLDVHIHNFIDMHDIGDALVRSGFEIPVVDVDHVTMTYASVRDALQDLKQLGSHNASVRRARGLTGKQRYARFCRNLEGYRDSDGRLPCTYEVIYGHAWAPRQQFLRKTDGSVSVPLAMVGRRPG